MNMFSFVRFFQSDKDIQLAFPQLQERISTELSVKHSCIENNKLCFTLQQQNVLFRNAFLPKVEMRVETDTTNTKLYVRFMLQKFVQVFMLIYFVLAGLLEIAMISIFLIGNLSSPLFLLLPVGLGAFAVLLAWTGLHFAAQSVIKLISSEGWKQKGFSLRRSCQRS